MSPHNVTKGLKLVAAAPAIQPRNPGAEETTEEPAVRAVLASQSGQTVGKGWNLPGPPADPVRSRHPLPAEPIA